MALKYDTAKQNLRKMNDDAQKYIEFVIQKAHDLCITTSKMFPIAASVDVVEELCAKLPEKDALILEQVFSDNTFTFSIGYNCSGKIWFEVEKPNKTNQTLVTLISKCLMSNGYQIDQSAETPNTQTYFIIINEEGK